MASKDVPKTVTFSAPATSIVGDAASEDRPQHVAVDQAEATFAPDANGRYERQRILGQGGMGTVILVRDRTVGRAVALKQLNFDANDAEDLARFAREARVQGQLEHPAIVPVYDVGTSQDGKPFFTMKRVRGESLQEVLEKMASGAPSAFSRRKLLSAFSQLCAAAHYAHERGVVHRDIKPTNIMLGAYGEVYLLDWGVAKVAGDAGDAADSRREHPSEENIDAKAGVHTGYGSVMGTLGTMAPEQAVGGFVDARTDVYALGAVLFEILTLQSFHPKGDFEEVIKTITTGIEARASVRFPEADVPPELEELCVRATRLQPADRLESAMLMREAIEGYLDGDRDLALRRELARKHAEGAKRAADAALKPKEGLEGPDAPEDENARTNALSEVGKALALDPENKDALGTLVSLLTTPPKVMPKEIALEHEAELRRNIRRAGIAASVVYGYISVNAIFTWTLGVRDMQTFSIAHILWGCAFVASLITTFRPSYVALFTTFLFGIGTTAFITSVYGPYLLVSTLITMHAVLFAFVRDWGPRIAVISISCIAWTVSVFGDAWGIFPKTVRFIDGDMLIHSTVIGLPEATTFYLYASVLATIIAPALVVGALRTAYHRSEVQMRLQSWQLSRLVSSASGSSSSSSKPTS